MIDSILNKSFSFISADFDIISSFYSTIVLVQSIAEDFFAPTQNIPSYIEITQYTIFAATSFLAVFHAIQDCLARQKIDSKFLDCEKNLPLEKKEVAVWFRAKKTDSNGAIQRPGSCILQQMETINTVYPLVLKDIYSAEQVQKALDHLTKMEKKPRLIVFHGHSSDSSIDLGKEILLHQDGKLSIRDSSNHDIKKARKFFSCLRKCTDERTVIFLRGCQTAKGTKDNTIAGMICKELIGRVVIGSTDTITAEDTQISLATASSEMNSSFPLKFSFKKIENTVEPLFLLFFFFGLSLSSSVQMPRFWRIDHLFFWTLSQMYLPKKYWGVFGYKIVDVTSKLKAQLVPLNHV